MLDGDAMAWPVCVAYLVRDCVAKTRRGRDAQRKFDGTDRCISFKGVTGMPSFWQEQCRAQYPNMNDRPQETRSSYPNRLQHSLQQPGNLAYASVELLPSAEQLS